MKISGARNDPYSPFARREVGEAAPRPVAEAPVVDQARFLGISENELTPAVTAGIAMLMAELDSLRLEVQRLKARLLEAETAADEDPLTGVKNRRAFLRELKRVMAFVQRYGAPASLVYVDIDDLKSINDRFGHAAGDAALKATAGALAEHVRESDVIGRLGGDEFAVLLVQADLGSAQAKAASLAEMVESAPAVSGDWLIPVRVSWGARQIDPEMEAEVLLAEADAAMFEMKRGRSEPRLL